MSAPREPKPFFRKSKNAWYLQIGKRQISLGKDKKQAWARYHELMAEKRSTEDETVTIETLLEHYLDWVQKNRSAGTYGRLTHRLSHFARYIGRSKRAASITGADLSAWVETEHSWNSTTKNDGIGAVVRAYNWAVGKRYLSRNYVAIVPDKPSRQRRETVLSLSEWKELLSHVKDQAFRDLLEFLHHTGCRPREARRMEAKHIDLKAGIVIFPPSEAKGKRHERVIYLTESALDICKRRCRKWPKGTIMRNTQGNPWTKDAINCRFQRLKKKLGKRVFAYAIRHSYATQGLINGVDSVTLSQLMGHADVSTLAKNYAHLSKNQRFLREQASSVHKTE
ncbi:MAG: tyrosine-type recombinase/integrase [Planctomycetota bacterium]